MNAVARWSKDILAKLTDMLSPVIVSSYADEELIRLTTDVSSRLSLVEVVLHQRISG